MPQPLPSHEVFYGTVDAGESAVHIRLAESDYNIIGSYRENDGALIFEPTIPFTAGLTYHIFVGDSVIDTIVVPEGHQRPVPKVVAVYPSEDTLPSNLLKMYVRFSHPMREGQSLNYITLLKNGKDTVDGVFLESHPELWSADQRTITLWLDPDGSKEICSQICVWENR